MIEGLLTVMGAEYMIYMFLGVIIGIVVGSLPGFTATMGTALMLPFTFVLPTGVGLGMLGALYVAAMYSDCIPATLVNTPGTPASMATAFDGYPMTLKGEGQSALTAGAFASMIGAVSGGFMFLFLAPPLATAALRFGPPEFFWIGVFAITIIGSIAGDSLLKGMAGGALGMLVSTVGLSTAGAVTRFTFGIPGLRGGVSLVAALIGIFALPQLMNLVAKRKVEDHVAEVIKQKGVVKATVVKIMKRPGNVIRSTLIGGGIGIIPGAGSPVAALVAYNESKRWARDRKEYGKGSVHGVVASETANSSAAGGALVPLIALGVPGSSPAAIIMGALLLKGIQPGPSMFAREPQLVYGFAWSVVIAGVVTFIVGSILARHLAKMVGIPIRILIPIILMLSLIGSYAIRTNIYDVYLMVGLGLSVFLLTKLGFHPGPIGLGLILGPIVEPALVQSLALSRASSWQAVFFTRPLSMVLIAMVVASIVWAGYTNYKQHQERRLTPVEVVEEKYGTKAVRESLVAGIVLIAVAVVFYFQTGERIQDWILPWVLTAFLALLGVTMIVRALIGRGGRPIPIVPVIFKGHGIDVAVAASMLVIAASLLRRVGFWLTGFLLLTAVSIYLTNERTRKAMAISVIVMATVVGALYMLLLHVFYVPVPKTFFLR
jgi:putative tricarboxylic transport membrane protein